MKTVEFDGLRGSLGQSQRQCEVQECGKPTREGKPFCSDHVTQHAYVRDILTLLSRREEEEEAVRRGGWRAVDPEGLIAGEIRQSLAQHGPRTQEGLGRELQLESAVLGAFVHALVQSGAVVLGCTRRGSTVLRLAGDRRQGEHESLRVG